MSEPAPATDFSESTAALMDRYVLGNYARFPVAFARGEGSWLWDESGRRYLDFATGIAVCSLGHCPPVIQEALREQAARLIHCSNLYQIREQAELARFIVERVMRRSGRVFFCNSGAEANDALIKLARKFGHDSAALGLAPRGKIITCVDSFHGRTLGGIAATGQDKVKQGFAPLLEGFVHVPFNDVAALRQAAGPDTAAILFEVVQGEGGIHAASEAFLRAAMELRREHGLLLMVDEVQCGFGRTGSWNAWESILGDAADFFLPDAVSWAKGMGGGFPVGAIWTSEEAAPGGAAFRVCDVLGPGSHGSTFGGTPLASAVALAVLREIEREDLAARAARLGARVREEVAAWGHPLVREIRGLGLLLGFVIDEAAFQASPAAVAMGDSPALHVVNRLREAGLLAVPAGPRVVRWLPPLTVSDDEVSLALSLMRRVLDTILSPAD